jgi:hypothetical protein
MNFGMTYVTTLTIHSLYQHSCHSTKTHNKNVQIQSALEDIVATGVLCSITLLFIVT